MTGLHDGFPENRTLAHQLMIERSLKEETTNRKISSSERRSIFLHEEARTERIKLLLAAIASSPAPGMRRTQLRRTQKWSLRRSV